jgi:hypothetical protein
MGRGARKGLFIAGGALAIVAALMVVTTRPAPTATDEDQVRRLLEGMNGSYNRSDFEAFASHVCADMLRAGGYEAGWYQSRESDGPTQITVNSIDVTGDNAVANVRFVAATTATPRHSTSISCARATSGKPAGMRPGNPFRSASHN